MEWKIEDNKEHHLKVLIAKKGTLKLWLRFGYHLNEDVSDGFYFIAELRDITEEDPFISSNIITTRKDLNDIIQEYGLAYEDGARVLLNVLNPYFKLHLCNLEGLPIHYADNALYWGFENKSRAFAKSYLQWTDDICSLTPTEADVCFSQFLLNCADAQSTRTTANVIAEFKQWLLEHGYNERRQVIANAAIETVKDVKAMLSDRNI